MSQLVYFAFRKNENLEEETKYEPENHIIFLYFYRSSPFYQHFRDEVGWSSEWRELSLEVLRDAYDNVKADIKQYRKKIQTVQSIQVATPETLTEVMTELEAYNEEISELESVLKNLDCLMTIYDATKYDDKIYYVFD